MVAPAKRPTEAWHSAKLDETGLGFEPHPDYKKGARVFNTIGRHLGTTGANAAALEDALPGTDEAGGQSDTSAAGAQS